MEEKHTITELKAALAAAQQRIAELEMAASQKEAHFASVFRVSPAQMALTEPLTSQYVEVNEAFLRTLGFTRAEVIGKTALELNLFVDSGQRTKLLEQLATQGFLKDEHVLVRDKLGEVHHGLFSAEYLQTDRQRLLLTVMNDVTQQMKAEERWKFALEGAEDGVWDRHVPSRAVFYSSRWKSMLGYAEDEIDATQAEWEQRVHPDDLAGVLEKIKRHLQGETPQYCHEYRLRCKDGTYKWILDRGKVIAWTEDQQPLRLIGTHKDISERKIAEEKLRESEARFSSVFQANPAAQLIVSVGDGVVLDANEAYCRQSGFARAELVGQTTQALRLWSDPARQLEIQAQLRGGLHVSNVEADFRTKSGARRTLLISFEPIELKGVLCLISSAVDITERKQAERALARSEKQYHSLVDALDVSLCRWLPDTTLTYANTKYQKIFGVQGEALGQKWLNFLPAEARASTAAFYREVAENPRTVTYEHPVTTEAGGVEEYQWIDAPIFDEHGQVTEFQSVGIDITARKQMEAELAESEKKYRELVQFAPVGIFEVNFRTGKLVSVNEVMCATTGYTRQELLSLHPVELLNLAGRALFSEATQKWLAGEPSAAKIEDRLQAKDGRELDALFNVTLTRDAEGLPLGATVIFSDITERKRSETLIAAQRDLARLTSANLSSVEIWKASFQTALRVSGLDSGGIYCLRDESRVFELVYHAGLEESFIETMRRVEPGTPNAHLILLGKTLYFTEHDLEAQPSYRAEGLRAVVSLPIFNQGEVLGCLNLASHTLTSLPDYSRQALEAVAVEIGNIIVHQRTEAALQASREQLRQALLAARMGTWRYDLASDCMEWSPEAAQIMGVEFLQADLKTVLKSVHPEDASKLQNVIQEAVAQKRRINLEYRVLDPLGKLTWVTSYGHLEYDSAGRPLAAVGLLQDITQRKNAEIALSDSEELHRLTLSSISDAVLITDFTGAFTFICPNVDIIFSYTQAEVAALGTITNLFGRELFDRAELERLGEIPNIEQTVVDKHGREHALLVTVKHIQIKTGTVLYTCHDITERKQAEAALRASEQKYKGIFDDSIIAIYMFDLEKRFIDSNQAGLELLGYSRAELLQLSISEVDADPVVVLPLHAELLSGGRLINYEHQLRKKDGSVITVLNNSIPLTDAAGQVIGMLSTLMEITERKQAEEKLRLTEQRYRALIENAPDGIMLIGADGKCQYASPSVEKLSGYTLAELQQRDLLSDTHPEELPQVLEVMSKMLADPADKPTLQQRVRHKNGEWRWLESTFSNLLALPSVGAIILNFRDVTERKLAEAELKKNQELLKEAQRIGQIGYMEWNRNAPALSCSDEIYEIFDVPPGTPISKALIDGMMPPGERQRLQELDRQAIQQRVDLNYEYSIQTRQGSERCLHQIGKATYGEDGKPWRLMMIVQNITARKQAETALRASEEKYRGLMESLENAVSTVDFEGRFLYMNDMGAEKLGGTPRDFIGKNMQEIFPEPLASAQLAAIRKIFETNQEAIFEARSLGAEKSLRWYRFALQPLHDETGRVTQVLINATDIHELKTTQQALLDLNRTLEERVKERTAQVQDLYDNAPVGYHSLDADGRFLAINQTELNWLGYAREELLGKSIKSIYPPHLAENFEANFQEFKAKGMTTNQEAEALRKDGSAFPIVINATAVYVEDGRYLSSRSTMTDITQLKLAENELKRNINFTRALLDAVPTPVFYKDRTGCYQGCNQAFAVAMGKTAEEIRGKTVHQLWPGEQAEVYHQKDLELMQNRGRQVYESSVLDGNGFPRPVIFIKDIFYDESGAVAGLVGAFIDITERKNAEDALRLTNVELERAIRVKDEFLASMSHELRTPLNAILGLSESLLEAYIGSLNDRQLRAVQTIETSGRHLLELINDILDLSKFEAGQVMLELTMVAVAEVCGASLMFIKELAYKKNLRVKSSLDPVVEFVQADERRLKQMLVNLLSNAVKFTPAGGVVELRVTGHPESQTVSFAVQDTGIGISPENLPRLFQPFVQLDGGLNRQFEGTGLGLSLVARMASLHGGQVAVESELGQGSCFTLTLPWKIFGAAQDTSSEPSETAAAAVSASAAVDGQAALILIVEDNETNLISLSIYLQARGYRIAVARNGQEGLEQARLKRPDLILMDLQMPVLDGLEATRRLRAESDPQLGGIPVIALTALAMPVDRERSLAAGANEYLSKPVNLKQLIEVIHRLMRER